MAKRPEDQLKEKIKSFLAQRGWLVEHTHGNVYQKGLPDLYCWNEQLGIHRWVDVKMPNRHTYTKDQCQKWTYWESKGLGVWIMMGASEGWYQKLFEPPNFREYWKPSYDRYLQKPDEVLLEEFPSAHVWGD